MAQQEDFPFGLLAVDHFYFSALIDDVDEPDPVSISDDQYAHELQFQETLLHSLITSQNASSSSSPSFHLHDLQFQEALLESLITYQNASSSIPTPPPPCVASSSSSSSSSSKAVDVSPVVPETEEEAGESSLIICEICAEPKGSEEMLRSHRCDHSFCWECVTKHVATKIQDSITVVSCPGLKCEGVLELDACRPMLPKDLIERWDDALCEALLLTAPKFYCPFRDCAALILLDEGEEEIRESECPFCHRLICARCHVPWHPEVPCEEEEKRGRKNLLDQKKLCRILINKKNSKGKKRNIQGQRRVGSVPEERWVTWHPSMEEEVIVLNVDGSSLGNPGRAGFGGLFRQGYGTWVSGFYGFLGVADSLFTELAAIFHGLRLAWGAGHRNLLCYSDSTYAIKLLTQEEEAGQNHRYAPLICTIKELLGRQWRVKIQHTLREGNMCADLLAKQGAKAADRLVTIQEAPVALHSQLLTDAMRVAHLRGTRASA